MDKLYELALKTEDHTQMKVITAQVREAVRNSGATEGICTVFVPHTTAAVTINMNGTSDLLDDFMREMNRVVPWKDPYRHHSEGNSAAHVKASIMGFSENIIIEKGELMLDESQSIYFLEYDGPKERKILVKIIGGGTAVKL